jgi:hypothetical protein
LRIGESKVEHCCVGGLNIETANCQRNAQWYVSVHFGFPLQNLAVALLASAEVVVNTNTTDAVGFADVWG